MIVDRTAELERLKVAAAQPPQLIVLRGRRRVGKSFLLNTAFRGSRAVFFQADEQDQRSHLELFATEAARLIPGAPPLRFPNWDAALELLSAQAQTDPLVVVLDEFQWLWAAQPALDSILQRHWDRWQRQDVPITLVLSGSALSMMERLLDHGSPLFGRANYRPLLLPLDFRDAAEFASPSLSAKEKLRRYAALGGTPQYQVWAGRGHLKSIIRDRILSPGESLYEDPMHLLRGEHRIRDPGSYFAILAAIARGATRSGEISNQAHITTPNLAKMLPRLEELGYVEERVPVEHNPARSRSSYRIKDPFFRFWFRYVLPNRSRLSRGLADEVMSEIEADFDTFMGLAFEDCCRDWIGRYGGDAVPAADVIGAYWSRDGNVEIDVVGMKDQRYTLLGSCKWAAQAPSQVVGQLRAHQESLGPRAVDAQLFVFASGFSDELIERADQDAVTLIDSEALFR